MFVRSVTLVCALLTLSLVGCDRGEAEAAAAPARQVDYSRFPIPPLPREIALDQRKVALGRALFHDTRLSRDNSLSCSSCHRIAAGGADDRAISVGVGGQAGTFNAPTVLNSGFNLRQFWDGRAATLEDQIDGPIHSAVELGTSFEDVIAKLKRDEGFSTRFGQVYSDGLTPANLRDAIATFERSLITPDSPFDRYIRGDKRALSTAAQRGYRLFQDLSCISCHQGINAGGNMYQSMGTMKNFFAGKAVVKRDLGRFNVTGDPRDRHKFKVPSLRNVALTAPYFHDGSVGTLEEAVRVMAEHQLGYQLTDTEVADLVAFLRSLTGKIPG